MKASDDEESFYWFDKKVGSYNTLKLSWEPSTRSYLYFIMKHDFLQKLSQKSFLQNYFTANKKVVISLNQTLTTIFKIMFSISPSILITRAI